MLRIIARSMNAVFLVCTASEETASDSAASKEKEKEKEDLPFDDPVYITLEYFRCETLQ